MTFAVKFDKKQIQRELKLITTLQKKGILGKVPDVMVDFRVGKTGELETYFRATEKTALSSVKRLNKALEKEGDLILKMYKELGKDIYQGVEDAFTELGNLNPLGAFEAIGRGIQKTIKDTFDIKDLSKFFNALHSGWQSVSNSIDAIIMSSIWGLIITVGLKALEGLLQGSTVTDAELKAAEGDNDKFNNQAIRDSLSNIEETLIMGNKQQADMVYYLDVLVRATDRAASLIGDSLSGSEYEPIQQSNVWGSKESELIAKGIKLDPTTLKQIEKGQLNGFKYQTEQITKSKFFHMSTSSKLQVKNLGGLENDLQEAISGAIIAGIETIDQAAQVLGMSQAEIDSFTAGWETIKASLNFEDMDPSEVQAALEGYVNENLTTYTEMLVPVMGYVNEFKKSTEDSSTALIRIANDVLVVKDVFSKLGITLNDLEQGGVATAEALVTAAGGAKAFADKWNNYFNNFYSQAEQTAYQVRQMTGVFGELGYTIPVTKEEYRALVDAEIARLQVINQEIAAMEASGTATQEEINARKDERDEIAKGINNIIDVSDAWIELNDIMANSAEAYLNFWDVFGTEEEQMAALEDTLRRLFEAVGLTLPASKEAMKQLYLETRAKVESTKQRYQTALAQAQIDKAELNSKKAVLEGQLVIVKSQIALGLASWEAAEVIIQAIGAIDIVIAGIDAMLKELEQDWIDAQEQLDMLDSSMGMLDKYYNGAADAAEEAARKAEELARAINDLMIEWMDSLEGAQKNLELVQQQTGLTNITYDNFLNAFQQAIDNGMVMDQEALDSWNRLSSALKQLHDAIIENTRANAGGKYAVELQQTWGGATQQDLVNAIAKETGLKGLTPENFLAEFNKALEGGLTIEEFNDWQAMSDVLQPLLQEMIDAANAEKEFYQQILDTIQEAYLGSLSYLNTMEKAVYAAELAQQQLENGDSQGYIDSLGKQLEYEKKMSITREDYALKFEEYIEELKNAEYEEDPAERAADSLEEIQKQIEDLKTAIERSSYQN